MFQTYFLLKSRNQKYSQFFIFLILYLHCWYIITIIYFYNFIFSALNKRTNTTKCNRAVIILQPNTYDKKGYVYFDQNWFYKRCSKLIHKRYSKLVSQVLLKTDPQTLLKIGFTSVTRNRPKTLLKLIHRCYSNWPTNVTQIDQNRPTNITQNMPTNVTQNRPTNVTQNRSTNITQNRPTNVI